MSYRIRFTLSDGRTGHWAREYATREEARQAIRERQQETGLAYYVEEVVPTAAVPDATPDPTASQFPGFAAWQEDRVRAQEAQIARLHSELAQLRDAYDAARQGLDVAKRNVARLESTIAMVQAAWAVSAANAAAANTLSAEAHCKTVASMVRLDRAIELGDAMHRAHPSEDWAAYKDTLAASRRGPAKASEEPGEGHHGGEGSGTP